MSTEHSQNEECHDDGEKIIIARISCILNCMHMNILCLQYMHIHAMKKLVCNNRGGVNEFINGSHCFASLLKRIIGRLHLVQARYSIAIARLFLSPSVSISLSPSLVLSQTRRASNILSWLCVVFLWPINKTSGSIPRLLLTLVCVFFYVLALCQHRMWVCVCARLVWYWPHGNVMWMFAIFREQCLWFAIHRLEMHA